MVITGNNLTEIEQLKDILKSQFHMKDLGRLSYFLGIEIDHNHHGLFLSQRKYVSDLLKEFGVKNERALKIPLDGHMKLEPNKGTPLEHPDQYRRLVGKLIYLTITRPDISFSVQLLSQFVQAPTSDHMQAAKRVLRYLKSAPGQGILLARSSVAKLRAFCDSDWASCPYTRRSTTGFCVLLGISPISWKCKKQSVVARSSAEAEYRAMTMTVCEITWIRTLLKDLGIKHLPPTLLNCDNQAALAIAANPVYHERTKHIEVDCHYIREKVSQGDVQPVYVQSRNQLADVLTKPLQMAMHYQHLRKMGVLSSTPSHLEGECKSGDQKCHSGPNILDQQMQKKIAACVNLTKMAQVVKTMKGSPSVKGPTIMTDNKNKIEEEDGKKGRMRAAVHIPSSPNILSFC